MKIQVEIHLSYESEVLAYGMITLEDLIRFPIQLRKYKNKETGKDLSFVSYPRREQEWKMGKCSCAGSNLKERG